MSQNLLNSGQVAGSLTNLLVNGGFEIWQRGNGPFTASSAYAADRWQIILTSGDTLSVSRDVANQAPSSAACAAVTYTKSTGASSLEQKLEDFAQLQGKTVSVSVMVKCSTANAVHVQINDSVGGTSSAEHPGDGAYHALTVTRSIPAGATSVRGVLIVFDASCTAYIDNVMLVVGSQPLNYVPLTPAEEWARCERYYEVLSPGGSSALQRVGYQVGGSADLIPISYTRKAVTPTITKVGTWTVSNCSQPGAGGPDLNMLQIGTNITATGPFQWFSGGASQYLALEANP